MDTVSMWAVGGIVAALLAVIGGLITFSVSQLKHSFQTLIVRIDRITVTLETHNDKLITILSKHEITTEWLDNHENRLDDVEKQVHKIELNCASNLHNHRMKK